jgi:hypothetical protein
MIITRNNIDNGRGIPTEKIKQQACRNRSCFYNSSCRRKVWRGGYKVSVDFMVLVLLL